MKKLTRWIHLFICLVTLVAFVPQLTSCRSGSNVAIDSTVFRYTLPDSSAFNAYCGYPLQSTFTEVQSVKVIYDIHARKLFYINSNKYRLHYDFCEQVLKYKLGLEIFNATNYTNSFKRDYLLATINYFKQSDVFALEFFADNVMDAAQISLMYKEISSSSFFKNRLKLFLNNENLNTVYQEGKLSMPMVSVDEIYQHQQYQMIEQGRSVGRLVIIDSAKKMKDKDLRNCIVVVKGTPLEMPICKAFISNTFQTPLSHIQVLSHHRRIPAAALKNCLEKYQSLDQKPVRVTVGRDSIEIVEISEDELIKSTHSSSSPLYQLKYDISQKGLIDIHDISKSMRTAVGNKAFNFSKLVDLSEKKKGLFKTPESAFVIPYSFYLKHIEQASIQKELQHLFAIESSRIEELRDQLKKVQKAIRSAPLDVSLLNQVNLKLQQSGHKAFRFRSSCNAEDLEKFSGAGLYDSYTGRLNDTSKRVESAIKKVWASTFNYRAFVERQQFNLAESTVMMGILVHRSFPDEKANGVVITKNIYRDDYPGYVVNVQQGDISVVNPPDNVTCDQYICQTSMLLNPLSDHLSIQYISRSSLTQGRPVLTPKEMKKLYQAIEALADYLPSIQFLDVEFKFEQNGDLYLKQVRPYQ